MPAPRALAWWELYGPDTWSQANDLSADEPDKLDELQRLFLIGAAEYNVLTLDDRRRRRRRRRPPVSDDYGSTNNGFTGRIDWVQLDADRSSDNNHLDERLRISMARQ